MVVLEITEHAEIITMAKKNSTFRQVTRGQMGKVDQLAWMPCYLMLRMVVIMSLVSHVTSTKPHPNKPQGKPPKPDPL
jgi:hypothetical protein